MSNISDILSSIDKLSPNDKKKLQAILMSNTFVEKLDMQDFLTNERFANGRVCPLCGSIHVVRNGHRSDGTQRFMCRDCHKSFVVSTNTIISKTRKDLSIWEKYISCMMNGLSIRKTADICGIHKNTAFYWRHKILDALQKMADDVKLDGIVEMDETFFSISYKGNHKKSKAFTMPRESRKRGGEVHTRGLSHEKVCVPCAVNRKGMSVARVSNLGKVSTQNLHVMFDGRVDKDATIVTDKEKSYVRFADANELKLVRLGDQAHKKGIYSIQHINNYHSRLKRFMKNFNGVSTKYLNNYLIWHNFVNYAKETTAEKQNILMRFLANTLMTETCRQISNRAAIPVLV